MIHLVYASSASLPFNKIELEELLQKARQRNSELGVTGMLLYRDGNFMQALEGEQEVVTKLVAKIERDPRHKGFLVLLRSRSEQRLFPEWSMGFRNLSDQDGAKPAGYTDFMNSPLTGAEFSEDPNRCMKLLLLFRKNM